MGTLFVFGTLKRGFANHRAEQGEPVATDASTTRRFPLRIVGRYKIPWLLDRPGQGWRITGELYRVDSPALSRLDKLEGVHRPGWFYRSRVAVRARTSGRIRLTAAWLYFGSTQEAARQRASLRAFATFTPSQNLDYLRRAGLPLRHTASLKPAW
jgi:gamma-glutamylaminecyclotransferase